MQGYIVNAISMYRKIVNDYSGSEPKFNESIKKLAQLDSSMIRAELKICPGKFYRWYESVMIEDALLPAMEKIADMQSLKSFLSMPEVAMVDRLM